MVSDFHSNFSNYSFSSPHFLLILIPHPIVLTASKRIQSIANVLRLSDVVCLAATRMYTLAVEHKFTKGRKALNVVAVCLYVACRQKETRNYMLIDFSDLLQVPGSYFFTSLRNLHCPRLTYLNLDIRICNWFKLSTCAFRLSILPIIYLVSQHFLNLAKRRTKLLPMLSVWSSGSIGTG